MLSKRIDRKFRKTTNQVSLGKAEDLMRRLVCYRGVCEHCGYKGVTKIARVYNEKFSLCRFSFLNCLSLCSRCIIWWTVDTVEGAEWFINRYPERYKELYKLRHKTHQISWDRVYKTLILYLRDLVQDKEAFYKRIDEIVDK